jgi:UDP-N-acetylglucosamine 1-carboxyvinyltransferase
LDIDRRAGRRYRVAACRIHLETPMDRFLIQGPCQLSGEVTVAGAKNAVLPLIAATLLSEGESRIRNVPDLRDTRTMARVLETLGATTSYLDGTLTVDAGDATEIEAPYDLVKTMRASVYVLGPLLARHGRAKVSLPGGCAWGPRPVDLHLKGMESLGAKVELEGGYIVAECDQLTGAEISFETSSVGATANVLMAAVLARGHSVLDNAAREPEVTQLAEALVVAGAKIEGIGTTRLEIEGVEALRPLDVAVIADRIEAGTFLAAAAALRSKFRVKGVRTDHLASTIKVLESTGCKFSLEDDNIEVDGRDAGGTLRAVTRPFPGFPTDMQAQTMAVACVADGISAITDTIYPDRFTHVAELRRLGADIRLDGNSAVIRGVQKLTSAPVMATDLRASAALIIAALAAEGTTLLDRVYHIDRGYERIEQKLRALGATIERVPGPPTP